MKLLRRDGTMIHEVAGAESMRDVVVDARRIGIDFYGADLREANLIGVDLSGSFLCDADLTRAVCCDADLHNSDLTRAEMVSAWLSGANLSGAMLDGANMGGVHMRGAILTAASIHNVYLALAKLSIGALDAAYISNVDMTDVTWHDEFTGVATIETTPLRFDQPTDPPDSGRDERSAMAAVRALLYPTLTGAEKAALRSTLRDCGYSIDAADGVLETIQEARDESWETAAAVFDRAEVAIAATLRED